MQKLVVLFVIALLLQCATVGPGGRRALVLIPTSQEIEIGKGVDANIKNEYKVYNEPALENYVKNIGLKIVSVCDRKDLPYTFQILDTDMINAFAAPGGYIYVTKGLLKFCDNEAQLAGIIGHEIGHVVGRHGVRALQKAFAMQYGISILAGALSDEQLAKVVAFATTMGAKIILQGYSREHEFEADEMATLYAYAAGYNPFELATFMAKLDRLSGGKRPKGLEKLFASHPPASERKQRIIDLCKTLTDADRKAINEKQFKAIMAKLK